MTVPIRPAVVDASVAVKLVIDEDYSDLAAGLYAVRSRIQRSLFAPTLLPNEVTNAIYRQLRRGNLSEAEADAAVARFPRFDIGLLAPADLPRAAYVFAKTHRLGAIYDALYVVLAQRLNAEFWTADRTLFNAVSGAAPWVRWIGDYRMS